jgi:hypothetical protein
MLSLSLPTLATLFLFYSPTVRASSCVAFDVSWNLLAFGLDGQDWNAGAEETWASGTSRMTFLIFPSAVLSARVDDNVPNLQAPLLTSPLLGVREFLLLLPFRVGPGRF